MISRISIDSDSGVDATQSDLSGINPSKFVCEKWEWSFLRVSQAVKVSVKIISEKENFQKECHNLGLDDFYRTYIHKMQRSYLSLILVMQAFVSISHIILLIIYNLVSNQKC